MVYRTWKILKGFKLREVVTDEANGNTEFDNRSLVVCFSAFLSVGGGKFCIIR